MIPPKRNLAELVSKRRKRRPIVTSVAFSSFKTSDSENHAAISGDGRILSTIGRMGNSLAHAVRSSLTSICAQHPEYFTFGLIELPESDRLDKIIANEGILGLDHPQGRVFIVASQCCKASQSFFIPFGL